MRKETSNQFTEGLVSDVNPINTPNTVLTDNLNGTIITYNGNEFSLQNDRGNYELKHCRLKPNYIPVGIKEYGDILYIVSYNPITEKVQIGSYPSPLTYESSEEIPGDREVESAIQRLCEDKNITEINYSDLIKELDGTIFNEDRFKLHPGDQYRLLTEDEWDYHFENIDYKIINDSSHCQNVTDLIKLNKDDYEYVSWMTPGFLSINSKLADIKIHGLNVKYFYIQEDEQSNKYFKFSISTQLNVEDIHLKDDIKKWIERINNNSEIFQEISFDLKLYEKYEKDGNIVENELFKDRIEFFGQDLYTKNNGNVSSNKFGYADWYDEYIYLWKNISGEFKVEDFERTIVIDITPVFHDKNDIKIKFDNLTQNLEFDLKEAENGTYRLGDELFKYKVDTNKKQLTIAFNTKSPLVTDGAPILSYKLNGFYSNKETEWKELSNEFGYLNEIEYSINLEESVLDIEDIGSIEFSIETNAGRKFLGKRLLITSVYLNDFYDDRTKLIFDRDIKLEEWMSKHIDLYELASCSLNASEFENKPSFNEDLERFYSGEFGSSFFPTENNLTTHNYQKGCKYQVSDIVLKSPNVGGNIWKNLSEGRYTYTDSDGNYSTNPYLYDLKQLSCKFIPFGEPIDYYLNINFVELEPRMDTLRFSLSGTMISVDYQFDSKDNCESWTSTETDDSDDYYGTDDSSKSLEKHIHNFTRYRYVDNRKEGTVQWNIYDEPQILSRFVPCRLLEVNLSAKVSNNCHLKFGVIKPANKESGPYDMDTTRLNYSMDEDANKTFYFLMMRSDSLHKVDGDNRYTGAYILIPFDNSINENGFEYYKQFCKKLIQPRSNVDNPEKIVCNCYTIKYDEIENVKRNTFEYKTTYLFKKDLNDMDVMYKTILEPDQKFDSMDSYIRCEFKKVFNVELEDLNKNFEFDEEISKISKLNESSKENYNSWLENPLNNNTSIERDTWICTDKNLRNDRLRIELTTKIDRLYTDDGKLLSSTGYPNSVCLNSSTETWMCARTEKGQNTINANRSKVNFVTFGTVWDEPDKSYIIGFNNWLE